MRRPDAAVRRPAWVEELTAEVLAAIPRRAFLRTRAEIARSFVPLSPSYLDHPTGLRRSVAAVTGDAFSLFGRSVAKDARRRVDAARGSWVQATSKASEAPDLSEG